MCIRMHLRDSWQVGRDALRGRDIAPLAQVREEPRVVVLVGAEREGPALRVGDAAVRLRQRTSSVTLQSAGGN